MENAADTPPPLTHSAKRLLHRLFVIGENRLHLLTLEVQEERDRVVHALWLAAIAAMFGLLAGVAFTFLVAAIFWDNHPIIALTVLFFIYVIVAAVCYSRCQAQKNQNAFSATLDQLKKDRECLEKQLN